MQKVDDTTVAFHLDQPFADFPYMVASTNYDCLILPIDLQDRHLAEEPRRHRAVQDDEATRPSRAPRS